MFYKSFSVCLLLFFINTSLAQVTYSYQGNNFDQFDPPFTASSQITGSFETAQAIAPSTTTDLTGSIQSFSFTDGQNTRDQSNSTLCLFDVTTNSAGLITSWYIYMRQSDTGPTENQHTIDLLVGVIPEELSAFDLNLGNTGCGSIGLGVRGSSLTAPTGAWSGGPQAPQSVPTLSVFLMLILGLILAGLGVRHIKE